MKLKSIIILIAILIISAAAAFSQTVVSIANTTNTLKITYSDGGWNIISKRGVKIINPPTGTTIYLLDKNKATYTIVFANITSPIAVDKNALAVVLKNYLN